MTEPAGAEPTQSSAAARAMKPGRLALLTLLALVLRLAFLALEPPTQPVGDERTWIGWGTLSPAGVASPEVHFSPLRTGVLFYPPVYPYFIGAVWALFGTLTAVKVAQAVVGSLLVPALGRIASRLGGARAGTWAAALAAGYPELVWFSVHFWSETLFLVFLWWGIERLLAADTARRLRVAAVAGSLWGLAVLTRETALYFVPLAAVWLALGGAGARSAARRRGATFLVAAVLVIAPWTLRNWVVHQALIPVSTAGGLNLWQGNARLTRQQVYDLYQAQPGLVAQYRHARRMGLRAIAERQPWWLVEKLREQMPLFWEADSLALVHAKRGAYGPLPRSRTLLAAALVLLPYLALLGVFVAACARVPLDRRAGLLLGFLAYYNLVHVATHGFARYRLPALPVLLVLSSVALAAWSAHRGRVHAAAGRRLVAAALAVALTASVLPSLRGWAAFARGALAQGEHADAPP